MQHEQMVLVFAPSVGEAQRQVALHALQWWRKAYWAMAVFAVAFALEFAGSLALNLDRLIAASMLVVTTLIGLILLWRKAPGEVVEQMVRDGQAVWVNIDSGYLLDYQLQLIDACQLSGLYRAEALAQLWDCLWQIVREVERIHSIANPGEDDSVNIAMANYSALLGQLPRIVPNFLGRA